MRLKFVATIIGVLGGCGVAEAQYPYGGMPGMGLGNRFGAGGMGMFMPNIYNPMTQPLSPYLNLFRGSGNPAANYYFGVRPGTVAGMTGGPGGAAMIAPGGNRGLFFPELATGPDPFELPESDPTSATALPPAGHPVVFGNTMGYFPNTFGYRGGNMGPRTGNSGGGGQGSSRSGGSSRR